MKLAITREWFERKAELEGDLEIAAGLLARDPSPVDAADQRASSQSDTQPRIAFGSLVEYLRRKRGLSMEMLAEKASIDIVEVMNIERDAHFRPEPRTVYQIATTFGLPNKALLQLSGNSTARDTAIHEHALRFAARSGESVQSLSKEEKRALEEFIAFLARQ
ncbi:MULTISPECIES: helix-turn-helix transcriptional regulator [unclassified Mesorhizobium]|uniref:helix-turn-helix domain-containing protein n=1 Tax=unclassified Mesorhizobium TaxID=325217 RepID=UPI0004CE7249|nr:MULTISPECIES: helix-turn-helix transcriptional regulator [unclassified Mesorhizobium]WJI57285.1 helix-turn-helix domain-containing protein [Mesorhizobium sp. C432A]